MKESSFLEVFYHDVRIHGIEVISTVKEELEYQELRILLELTDGDGDLASSPFFWCYLTNLIVFSCSQNFYYASTPMISSVEKLQSEDIWVKEQLQTNKEILTNKSVSAYRVYSGDVMISYCKEKI